jgi:hypothetical protein
MFCIVNYFISQAKIDQGDGGKDEMRKVENWETRNRLLDLIQIVSVPSVVKLVWIDRTKAGAEKMKLEK